MSRGRSAAISALSLATCVVIGWLLGHTAFAGAPAATLTEHGTDLGRVAATATAPGLAVTVATDGVQPDITFVIARFQSNQALVLSADGLWQPWDGDVDQLIDSGFRPEGNFLTFSISNGELSDMPFPVIFTVGYTSTSGTRFGFLVVDEP